MSIDADHGSRGAPARRWQRSTVGKWQLLGRLGSGSWTTVYRARPLDAAQGSVGDYAIKMLQPEHADDAIAQSLLQREAFVAQQVAHPHVVTILSAQLAEPPHYLVLPYYAGVTLAAALTGAMPTPLPHVLWITRQLAEALHALHRAGWLHRDVNPANVMISAGGHATLLDLGLARRLTREKSRHRQSLEGTPAYMAPESFHGSSTLTPASDIYSLGVILYQTLVGTRPFEDDDPLELVRSHVETPPPSLRERFPHIPTRVVRLVRRMLAKDALRRPDAEELIATLTELEIATFRERAIA